MLIFLNPGYAFLLLFAALLLSVIPKRFYSNLICTILDIACAGAGDVIRKRYFNGISIFIIGLVVLVMLNAIEISMTQSRTYRFMAEDISFYKTGAGILASLLYAFGYSVFRSSEIEMEHLERERTKYMKNSDKKVRDFEATTGMSLGSPRYTPAANMANSRDAYDDYRRERKKADQEGIDWHDEVMEIGRRQEEIDRQVEADRQFHEESRHFHDGF